LAHEHSANEESSSPSKTKRNGFSTSFSLAESATHTSLNFLSLGTAYFTILGSARVFSRQRLLSKLQPIRLAPLMSRHSVEKAEQSSFFRARIFGGPARTALPPLVGLAVDFNGARAGSRHLSLHLTLLLPLYSSTLRHHRLTTW
jgi:hypothetical protein